MFEVCPTLRTPASLFHLLILVAREQTLSLHLAHRNHQIEARDPNIAYLESLNAPSPTAARNRTSQRPSRLPSRAQRMLPAKRYAA